MEFLADGPAVLGGIMLSVALGAWALGRWQGGLTMPDDLLAPSLHEPEEEDRAGLASLQSGAAQCPDTVRAERRSALAVADSLGELHAEICAYRRAQQVLVGLEGERLRLRPLHEDARSECRHPGVMDEPFPLPAMAERLRQPAPPAAGLTRV